MPDAIAVRTHAGRPDISKEARRPTPPPPGVRTREGKGGHDAPPGQQFLRACQQHAEPAPLCLRHAGLDEVKNDFRRKLIDGFWSAGLAAVWSLWHDYFSPGIWAGVG